MGKLLLGAGLAAILASAGIARADIIPDPLHLSCSTCSIDNGTFTPTNTGTPTGVTVDSSPPGATGNLLLKILVPTDEIGSITGVGISGASSGTAALQPGTFNSGTLEGFLNIGMGQGASANPIGAFTPSTGGVDSGFTGSYDVFLLNTGLFTLTGAFGTTPAMFNINTSLPLGTWILGDIVSTTGCPTGETFCNDVTTAPSSALFVNDASVPGPTIGAGVPGIVVAILAMIGFRRARRMRSEGKFLLPVA